MTNRSAWNATIVSTMLIVVGLDSVMAADIERTDESQIEVISTTASRIEVATKDIPLAITVLSEEVLDTISATHIEESLQWVAGANFHRGNGQEYLPSLRSQVLSGAGACGGLLTLEDDIPLRSAGFCNINELFESHSELASRIEVLKGPGSALYGSNAVHGVVNVITPNTAHEHVNIGIDVGSYGYQRLKLTAGQTFQQHSVGIATSITNDSGYRDDEKVEQQKISLRHRYDPNLPNEFTVTSGVTMTNLNQDTAGYIEGFESYKDTRIAQQNFDPDAFRDAQAFRAWSKVEWRNHESSSVTITPYIRDQKMTFFKHFLPGTPLEENDQKSLGVQSLWQQGIEIEGFEQVTLSSGVDIERTKANFLQYQTAPTQGSAFLVATVPTGRHYDYQVTADLLAPFVSIEAGFADWSVSLGARYETLTYDYTNLMSTGRLKDNGDECGFGGCRYSRPASSQDDFGQWSPKLSLAYQWSDNDQLYAGASKGYRAPQAAELYQLQRQQTIADLKEEVVTNFEIGAKGFYDNGRYLVSLYSMQKENTIYRDSDFFNVSDGQTAHTGIEIEAMWKPTSVMTLSVAATHARHQYDNTQFSGGLDINGNDIDSAPRNIATLGMTYDIYENASVGLNWHTVGRYFTDPENLHEYDGHKLLDLTVKWQMNDRWSLRFAINNLTNQRYAERADYTSFTQDRYFPGKPRTVMISINHN